MLQGSREGHDTSWVDGNMVNVSDEAQVGIHMFG
jgi:hypothetical protein